MKKHIIFIGLFFSTKKSHLFLILNFILDKNLNKTYNKKKYFTGIKK